jgi:hypothetical protein
VVRSRCQRPGVRLAAGSTKAPAASEPLVDELEDEDLRATVCDRLDAQVAI